jgi:hypothetical protein
MREAVKLFRKERVMNYNDYIDAGFNVFGLNSTVNGACTCGNPNCLAILKHPVASNWQHTPEWSDEQLGNMEEAGHFKTGWGVLCNGYVVIDIDPRNDGSIESLPIEWTKAGFTVQTGGSGWHIYWKLPAGHNTALLSHLTEYKGIDFKVSGFVVGCGSLHASGLEYEALTGHPCDVTDAPQSLLDALEKTGTYKTDNDGAYYEVCDDDIRGMLEAYKNDSLHYEEWIIIGMAIHHATGGEGFKLWDEWSMTSEKYSRPDMDKKWHSFGKSASPVTIGTLIYHAEEAGYLAPVTFIDEEPVEVESGSIDVTSVDLLRPPGFVGDLAKWIGAQCRYPRERLSVATALVGMGNVAGLRYVDSDYGVNTNLFMFCVAGSATGKEAIQQSLFKIMVAAGLSRAVCGSIKSEQEIIRNLMENQACFYIVDEIGTMLKKLTNAQRTGSSPYLEGVIGMLMSAYSKANGSLPLSGDAKKSFLEEIQKKIKMAKKKVDDNEDKGGFFKGLLDCFDSLLSNIDMGIEKPLLSLIGFTTPVTFDSFVDFEQATNGFIGRSIVIREPDTNPKIKRGFKAQEMPTPMALTLAQIASGGDSDKYKVRIQNYDKCSEIKTTGPALDMLDNIQDELHLFAESVLDSSLEAIPRRGFEMVLKVSLILAVPEGLRTVEHVRWAYAYIKRDIEQKMGLANANIAEVEKRGGDALKMRILSLIDSEEGQTEGVIVNRCRKYKKPDVIKALELMEKSGALRRVDAKKPGRPGFRWFK